jgi:hypothetical protein
MWLMTPGAALLFRALPCWCESRLRLRQLRRLERNLPEAGHRKELDWAWGWELPLLHPQSRRANAGSRNRSRSRISHPAPFFGAGWGIREFDLPVLRQIPRRNR